MSTTEGKPDKIRVGVAQTPAEKERIYAFRYRIYVEEMGKEGLSYADDSRKELRDDLDESALLFYAEDGGDVVATLRMHMDPTPEVLAYYGKTYELDRFADWSGAALSFSSRLMLAQRMRGTLTLYHLLSAAYEEDLRRGVEFDFCNCAPSLISLYEHLGYRRFTDNFVDPDVGYRVPMVLLLRDMGHLTSARSPFLRRLRSRPPRERRSKKAASWFDREFPMARQAPQWMLSDEDFWRFLASRFHASPEDHIPLLAGMNEQEAQEFLQKGTILKFDQGEKIIRVNDVGSEMYVVLSGLIQVLSPVDGSSVAVFGPGQVIGEIGLLLGCGRTANVVAVDSGEILVIDRAHLVRMMEKQPALAAKALFNLCGILSERLVAETRLRSEKKGEAQPR